MATRTFNVSALSPILQYDPPQDVTNSVWKSDSGGITNGNLDSGSAGRLLQGTGTVTVSAFGSGLGFAGSMTGVYCNYTATLSPGVGNSQSQSSLPPAQTASPSTGMLTSFTGLDIGNWDLQLKGDCIDGSKIKITEAVIEGWVGVQGGSVSTQTLDDTSPDFNYSGVDWTPGRGLSALFYDDTQHYTSSGKATMNYTFSGTAIVVWSSVDNQHGPYAASLHYASSSYDDRNTLYSTAYNPFLAVPIPFFLVTGLDPSQSYTLVLQNKSTNGTYLDLDYIDVYTSTGGGPPNGGTSAIHVLGSPSSLSTTAIIGAAVGGGVVLLLLILAIWFFCRRRKIQVDRTGGTQPLDIDRRASLPGHHVIPLQMHGNVLPTPFHSTAAHSSHSLNAAAERQGLLHGGPGGYSPPNTGTPMVGISNSSSSGYDPYASYGGGYPSPHTSSNTGAPWVPTDHVQARRQGKAAELDAARERAMRIQSNNGSVLMSPTTPNPNNTQTYSTTSQSWDVSSQGPSTPGPTADSNQGDVKLPDEPPPSYNP